MWRMTSLAALIVAGLCGVVPSAHARPETLKDLLGNRDFRILPALPADAAGSLQHRRASTRGNPTRT